MSPSPAGGHVARVKVAPLVPHRRTHPLASRSLPQCIPDFMGTFFLSS